MKTRIAFLLLAGGFGCVAPNDGNRFQRHFSSDLWLQSLDQGLGEPTQWVPEATLLAAAPVLYSYDDEIQNALSSKSITGGSEKTSNRATFALGAITVGYAGWHWAAGDGGEAVETAAETLLLNEAVVGILKVTVNHKRPNGSNTQSFPSGHAAFSFAAATFLARDIEQRSDSALGYLFYLPATWIAIGRMEGGRHWASDTAAGAAIGLIIGHTIFNLHYGDEPAGKPGLLHRPPPKSAWQIVPFVDGNMAGFALSFRL